MEKFILFVCILVIVILREKSEKDQQHPIGERVRRYRLGLR